MSEVPSSASTAEVPSTTVTPTNTPSFAEILEQGWLAPLIVQQLPPAEALRFAAASRTCRVVRLRSPKSGLEASRTWHNSSSQYCPHEWQKLRINEHSIHTVLLRCMWKDQGWGNRKGMLSVVAEGGQAPNDYQQWSPAVMCGMEPAPHDWEHCHLRFCPQPIDDALQLHSSFVSRLDSQRTYTLYARAGGGGGHSLSIKDLTVRVLEFVSGED